VLWWGKAEILRLAREIFYGGVVRLRRRIHVANKNSSLI